MTTTEEKTKTPDYDSPRTAEIVNLINKATTSGKSLNDYLVSIGKPRNKVANVLYKLDEDLSQKKITQDDYQEIKVAIIVYNAKREKLKNK